MIKKEKITDVNSVEEISNDFFNDNQSIERYKFNKIIFEAKKFTKSLIRSCYFLKSKFIDCIFDDMDLQRVDFSNCEFENCIFSKNFRFITGKVLNCAFIRCDFSSSFIQNVKFNFCQFNDSDFKYMKAKSIDFTESKFNNINFDGSNIVRGVFKKIPNIQRKLFYNVKIDDCQFDWNEAFIVMQFNDEQIENLYQYAIVPILDELGIEPKRVDKYEFKGKITDEILQNIVTCQVVIAECSAANKNVYFEVGYALGNNKNIIFLVDDSSNIPFDLKDYKFIIHKKSIDKLKEQIKPRIKYLLGLDN